MGTGKKKIEIEKITKETSKMVTFSKRRKGLFKKAKELEFMTGSRVASVVFSPIGRPYTCGDVNSAIMRHFSNRSRCTDSSPSGLNLHDSSPDFVVDSGGSSEPSRSSSTPRRDSLCDSVESIDAEQCNSDVVGVVFGGSSRSRSSLTPSRNGLRNWVEGIDVEGCQNLNQLLMFKEQLEGTREKISSIEDSELFQALFV